MEHLPKHLRLHDTFRRDLGADSQGHELTVATFSAYSSGPQPLLRSGLARDRGMQGILHSHPSQLTW